MKIYFLLWVKSLNVIFLSRNRIILWFCIKSTGREYAPNIYDSPETFISKFQILSLTKERGPWRRLYIEHSENSYSAHTSCVILHKLTYPARNWLLLFSYMSDNARPPDSIGTNTRMLFSTVTLLVCYLLGQMESKMRTIGSCMEVLANT